MPIVFATNNSVIQIEDRENERSAHDDYRRGVAYTIGLMILILFVIMIILIVSYYTKN